MKTAIKYAHEIGPYKLQRNTPPGVKDTPWGRIFPGQGQDGYGRKITTDICLRFDHEKIVRRVFCTCISNAASHWIIYKGEKVHLRDHDSSDVLPEAS